MTTLPPLPKLTGDIILDVFTHRSLRFPGAPISEDSEYGDNERLAVLGEKALETAVTDTLFKKRPMLKAADIEVRILMSYCFWPLTFYRIPQKERKELLSSTNIEHWIVTYRLREKLRCAPDVVEKLKEPEVRHYNTTLRPY